MRIVLCLVALAALPLFLSDYGTGLLIGMVTYVALASAWALFSGSTRYVSLATVAFYGTGAYCVAVLNDVLPYPAVLATAALIGAVLALAGAIASPRWVYVEPAIVFNPTISFLTVIMALPGGAGRLSGPALGAVPPARWMPPPAPLPAGPPPGLANGGPGC